MSVKKHIVNKDETVYEAQPDVVLSDSGKLICVLSECLHHVDRTDARIDICESTDRGRTWTKKKYLTEKGTKDSYFNCARISKLNDGSEGIQWDEAIQYNFCGIVTDKLTQLKCSRLIISAHFASPTTKKLQQYLWYSDDNGKSWSDKVTVAADERYNLCEVTLIEG